MKLRYMIDSILVDRKASIPEYVPVGVWVQGPGPGLDLEMYYLNRGPNGLVDRKDEAAWVVNRLVEAGATSLPADFLEYHRLSRTPYDGVFSEITETEEYPSLDACGKAVLVRLNNVR
ncbi:MAG: hypothetical protein ACOX5J_07510 [Candidatus Hydrogenedentales bacterium]|jgi:hypothetical protein